MRALEHHEIITLVTVLIILCWFAFRRVRQADELELTSDQIADEADPYLIEMRRRALTPIPGGNAQFLGTTGASSVSLRDARAPFIMSTDSHEKDVTRRGQDDHAA